MFILRKMSESTRAGFILDLFLLTRFPARLNTLSLGTEEAGIPKYFLAKIDSLGNMYWCFFHHSNKLKFKSSGDFLDPRYMDTSLSITTVGDSL